MHTAAMRFVEGVRQLYPDAFMGKSVLEVGSRYINGTVRTLFSKCAYQGIDLSPGPLVDTVKHVADMTGQEAFGTIISCEALEHDRRWEDSLRAMVRLLKPNGLLVLTCAAPGRPEHGTKTTSPGDSPATSDYYRNIGKEDFWQVIPSGSFSESALVEEACDLRFWGLKEGNA